jgi:hypothetical protein
MAIAFGAAAAAGAAQLGIGYGLGVFSWLPTVAGVDDAAWQASLAWTVWITATSVVLGSIAGDRGVGLTALSRLLLRIGIVLSAALGGVAVTLMIALPSRAAVRADTFAPETIVGGYAIAGVLLGLAVALAAVHVRPMAINVVATTSWLWLLAAVAFTDALGAGRDLTLTELSVWHVTIGGPVFRGIYLPGAVMVLTASLIIGGLAAWPIARAEGRKASAALSGAGGPLLLAGAYLLTAPAFAVDLFAPCAAVLSGLIGSVAITGLAGRRGRSGAGRLRRDNSQPTLVSAAKPKIASDAI